MIEQPLIFPLPAGATLPEQAGALARAAWLMSAPGDSDPPVSPVSEENPDASRREIPTVPPHNARPAK